MRKTYNRIQQGLNEIFKYNFGVQICQKAKYELSDYYEITYEQILLKLQQGKIIHADETAVKIRGLKSYIWVFTSLEEVLYVYQPTREGAFLHDILQGFNGVLISDFYSAYDSIKCPQQKCLIHLIRDMNDDLRKNPFDEEYKQLIKDFGEILQSIVLTIDKFGFKKRKLGKHKKETKKFLDQLFLSYPESRVVRQYQKRFRKYRNKLFTFLDYDGVPWNNNTAEHAIKTFALYRRITDGCFTEKGIRQYLILLSVYQTCQYRGTNFLDFMRSKETDINKFCS